MKKLPIILLLLALTGSGFAQSSKQEIITQLSGILSKAVGITWTIESLTESVVRQEATSDNITLVLKKSGFMDGNKIDGTYTYSYQFSWTDLSKYSFVPLEKRKFSLSGCGEQRCSLQVFFADNKVAESENGKSKRTSSWFYAYTRPEDKDRFFQLLEQLYKLEHP